MSPPNNGPRDVNKWLITIAVMAGTFMEIVDTTVVNVALPHIAGSLASSEDETTWILTAYLVSNAVILPITGWLAALFGRKRFLILCITLFTVSSMLCGMATNLGMLIVFRIIQGVGGGALQPISQAILLETFPVEERGMAMALWGIGVIIAPIVGPVMGGWVTDNLTWRWAFYINLPIGIVSLLLTYLFVFDPDYIRKQRAGSIDYWGLGLLVVGLGALQVVLDKGEREDWFSSAFITRLAIIAAVALIVLIYHELKTRHPVVDLRLFKERNYASGTTIMFFFGFVLYGSIMLLPLFLQTLMGYDATLAGWALAFGGIGSLMIMPVVGRLTQIMDSRKIVFVGLVINAYAVYLMSQYNTGYRFRRSLVAPVRSGLWPGGHLRVPHHPDHVPDLPGEDGQRHRHLQPDAQPGRLLRHCHGHHPAGPARPISPEPPGGTSHPSGPAFSRMAASHVPGPAEFRDQLALWNAPQAMAGLYQEVLRQARMLAFCDDYWFFTIVFLLPPAPGFPHAPPPQRPVPRNPKLSFALISTP